MIGYAVFALLRLAVAAFALLTTAYGVIAYSPFGFQIFIGPRVFAPVNQFAAWHHVWYGVAYLAGAASVFPDLARPRTRGLVLGYLAVFGAIGVWLAFSPLLPTLGSDRRSLIVALASLAPLLWLALIDHVATHPAPALYDGESAPISQRRLLFATAIAAEYLWLAHLLQSILRHADITSDAGWALVAAWSLALHAAAFMIAYAVLSVVGGIAAATGKPRQWEYGLLVGLGACVIAAILLEFVLPAISFGAAAGAAISIAVGGVFALAWSGIALRRPYAVPGRSLTAFDVVVSPFAPPDAPAVAGVALLVLSFAVLAATNALARFDWNNLLQKLVVLGAWGLALTFVLALSRRVAGDGWSAARAILPPLLALVATQGVATVSASISRRTIDPFLQDDLALDRYASIDPSFRLAYETLVEHPGIEPAFNRWLEANTNIRDAAPMVSPPADFAAPIAPGPQPHPHIFLFAIDSLRPDYLSAYNPAVTFTPNIGRFAADSLVFRNAFTRYGGTSLAIPSIWSGALLLHRTDLRPFHPINAIEKLLDADGYRRFVSLDTVIKPLLTPSPSLTELDADRSVMQFDLCHTLEELEARLTGTERDPRPVFAYSLAQNIHVANLQNGPSGAGESYPGFFAPDAAKLRRIDGCFGGFVDYLKRERLYDDSIIVLLSDHGDSLGEDGAWGHGVPLFPEIVRIPLIVHVPARLKTGMTADLNQVTFSTDVAPTLYQLAGLEPRNLGPLFGRSVIVPADAPLTDDRRWESFLLVSGYAPTYAVLRRNGRLLYIVDLINRREYEYDMTAARLGKRIEVTAGERAFNRGFIRAAVARLAAAYHFAPSSRP